jgi:replication factor C small subunit
MRLKKQHTIWVEKYRPDSLDSYLGNSEVIDYILRSIETNDLQHTIFYGKAGTGKTTAAKILASNLNCDSIYLNCSDENGIDTIRDKVKTFASSASFKPLKLVILDEADYITLSGQAALRNIIETYSKSTRFIFTCNYIEKIIDPLKSRAVMFQLTPPSKKEVAMFIHDILEKESVEFELENLAVIINKYFPDIRKTINVIQGLVHNGVLKEYNPDRASTDYMNDILDKLKRKDRKNTWADIRQIVVDNHLTDFTELYRFLYEKVDEYAPKSQGECVIHIADAEYTSNFVPDREITFMSTIHKILNSI